MMVVAIHTFDLSGTGISLNIKILIRQLLNCAVPLFLASSGFFLTIRSKSLDYRHFIQKQIIKVYIPCLIWSLPYFVYSIISGHDIWISILLLLSCGYSIYYFIALIMQYYFLLPILKKNK